MLLEGMDKSLGAYNMTICLCLVEIMVEKCGGLKVGRVSWGTAARRSQRKSVFKGKPGVSIGKFGMKIRKCLGNVKA